MPWVVHLGAFMAYPSTAADMAIQEAWRYIDRAFHYIGCRCVLGARHLRGLDQQRLENLFFKPT
eukprot:3702756-Karenia_brevis.AAC.1